MQAFGWLLFKIAEHLQSQKTLAKYFRFYIITPYLLKEISV
jgi:hypothetical protein